MPETLRPDETLRLDLDAVRAFQQARRKGSLLVIDGLPADVGTHLVIEESVLIGREPTGLQLRDGRASRRHAVVERVDDQHVLSDLGSTNGTIINGTRLDGACELSDGDKIFVGRTVIKFTLVDETEASYLRRMEQLAGTDDLTGLLAKHRFDSLLEEALRVGRLSGRAIGVLMMDLDGIKAINDAHGHHLGAHTIREVGRLIGTLIRGRGEACRFGGDEFCVFLPGASLRVARTLGETIVAEVRQMSFSLGEHAVRTTISVGVASSADERISSAEELLRRADQALYRAKAGGRNQVCE